MDDSLRVGRSQEWGCHHVSGHYSFGLAPEIRCAGSEEEGFYLGRQAGNSGRGRFGGTCNQLSFLSSDGGFRLLLSNFSAVSGSCHVPVDTSAALISKKCGSPPLLAFFTYFRPGN